jgi:drug/metabolite transporter (DMT)-like permease
VSSSSGDQESLTTPDAPSGLPLPLPALAPSPASHSKALRIEVLGTAALLCGIACWGAVPVFLRELSRSVDAWTANGLRYPFAALLYWPVLLIALRRGAVPRNIWRLALVPALFSFLGQIFFALAPYYLEAGLVGFLIKLSIFWTAFGAMLLFPDERSLLRDARFWIGFVLAGSGLGGLALLRGVRGADFDRIGIGIAFFCGLFFGLYAVSVRRYLRGVRSYVAFGAVAQIVSLGAIALMILRWTLFREHVAAPDGSRDFATFLETAELRTWLLLAISSVIGIGISHTLYFVAIQRLGPTLASSGHLIGPFVTIGLGRAMLGESLGSAELGAGITMLAGGASLILAQDSVLRARRLAAAMENPGNAVHGDASIARAGRTPRSSESQTGGT